MPGKESNPIFKYWKNIPCDLKRTIKWDPKTEKFIGDTDGAATKKMHYEYRAGWKLL